MRLGPFRRTLEDMLPVRRASIVAVVVGAMTMFARTPTAQQGNVANVMVPAGSAVPLSTPITPVKTIETIRQVLSAAKVPFGIEGAAYHEPPLVDLAQPRVEIANLHAMSVAAALDAIAHVDPSVHWREQDGVIVVRMTAGPTWIDRDREPFSVADADTGQALDALVSAADPSRRGHVAPFGPRATAGTSYVLYFPGSPPPQPPPRITVALDRGTMLEGLNALARAAHGSWRITYDGPAVEANDATIALFVVGASVEALSPLAERLRADPNRIETMIGAEFDFAILSYARSAHISVGVESLPSPEFVPGSLDPQDIVLVLDGREPRASLERLLAYDSRYVLSEEHGVFHVRPATGPVVPALSEKLAGFSVTGESVESVLNRILHRTAMQPIAPMRPQTSVSAAPVSLTIADEATVRDALDALCRTADGSWDARVTANGDVELTIAGGARTMTTVINTLRWRVPSVVRTAVRPPGVVGVPQTVAALREVLPVAMAPVETPFGAYLLDTAHTPGERRAAFLAQAQAPTFSTVGQSGPDVLARLLGGLPDYRWSLESGVYHVQPAGPIEPDAVINRRLGSFEIRVLDLQHAAGLLVDLIVGRQSARPWLAQAANTGPVHLAFPGGAARDALDAVTRTHDAPSWILTVTDNGGSHFVALFLCQPDGSRCASASAIDR
jgi:hypothetical protein